MSRILLRGEVPILSSFLVPDWQRAREGSQRGPEAPGASRIIWKTNPLDFLQFGTPWWLFGTEIQSQTSEIPRLYRPSRLDRRTVSRRDKIFAAAPLSLRMCHTRVFWVTIDSEPVEESFNDLWPLIPSFYQWDPSIISTELTRTDGPSRRRDKISAAAPLSLRMRHMRVFWITIDSESVELISGLRLRFNQWDPSIISTEPTGAECGLSKELKPCKS